MMLSSVSDTFWYYIGFYQRFFADQWANIGPEQYGTLLILIAVFGYLLMKSGMK